MRRRASKGLLILLEQLGQANRLLGQSLQLLPLLRCRTALT